MPLEFDPHWEYWDGGDEEVREILSERELEIQDTGFRIGTGNPDQFLPSRLAKSKTRPAASIKYDICKGCGKRHEVRRHGTDRKFCSLVCANKCNRAVGTGKVVGKFRECETCRTKFTLVRSSSRYCSIGCANKGRTKRSN